MHGGAEDAPSFPRSQQRLLCLNPGQVGLTRGFTQDVRNLDHLGTGDLKITTGENKALTEAYDVIATSYEAR